MCYVPVPGDHGGGGGQTPADQELLWSCKQRVEFGLQVLASECHLVMKAPKVSGLYQSAVVVLSYYLYKRQ